MRFRAASRDDAGTLSDLAVRSKAHWGYDDAFIDACRAELRVDPDDLDRLRITVAEGENGDVVGFSALTGTDDQDAELVSLFVEPAAIGTGVGSQLFTRVVAQAEELGLTRFRIESDPHAAPFYERMGAELTGRVASQSIPDRTIPTYVFTIERESQLRAEEVARPRRD